MRPASFFFEYSSGKNFNTYSGIKLEQVVKQMSPNVDRYNLIFDAKDFGFDNIDLTVMMESGKVLNNAYTGRINKIFVVNKHWLLSTFITLAQPFMHKATVSKIVYLDDSNLTYLAQLSQYYSEDQIPADYGGKGPYLPKANLSKQFLKNHLADLEDVDDDYEEDE
jgi:hypothetical protein